MCGFAALKEEEPQTLRGSLHNATVLTLEVPNGFAKSSNHAVSDGGVVLRAWCFH